MSQSLTRRQFARLAVAGLGGAVLVPAFTADADPPAAPTPMPTPPKTTPEGELLAQLVPVNVGYPLTDAQTKEVRAQIGDYPGGFAKARALALPDEVGPAFAALSPAPVPKKGRRR